MENTLGDAISDALKESSFYDNLDDDLIEALVAFLDLLYEQFKRKVESTDQEMQEQKLGKYTVKQTNMNSATSTKLAIKDAVQRIKDYIINISEASKKLKEWALSTNGIHDSILNE